MCDNDCGEIPVVDENERPMGVITDRDIACRVVAEGRDPSRTRVREVMSTPVVTARPQMAVEDVCRLMEENQVRRVPVVDDEGVCCGIVAQADIALNAPEHETAEVVRDISQPTSAGAHLGGLSG